MALRTHEGERLVVAVEHHYSGGDPAWHAWKGRVDQHHFSGSHAGYRGVEAGIRRHEFWEFLFQETDHLCGAELRTAEPDPIGLLPELPKTLQRPNYVATFHVQADCATGDVGYPELRDRPGPIAGIARSRWLSFGCHVHSLLPAAQWPNPAARASASARWI